MSDGLDRSWAVGVTCGYSDKELGRDDTCDYQKRTRFVCRSCIDDRCYRMGKDVSEDICGLCCHKPKTDELDQLRADLQRVTTDLEASDRYTTDVDMWHEAAKRELCAARIDVDSLRKERDEALSAMSTVISKCAKATRENTELCARLVGEQAPGKPVPLKRVALATCQGCKGLGLRMTSQPAGSEKCKACGGTGNVKLNVDPPPPGTAGRGE